MSTQKGRRGKPLLHTDQNSACFWETPICDRKEVGSGLCKHNCFHLSPRQPSIVLHTWVSGRERESHVTVEQPAPRSLQHPGEESTVNGHLQVFVGENHHDDAHQASRDDKANQQRGEQGVGLDLLCKGREL